MNLPERDIANFSKMVTTMVEKSRTAYGGNIRFGDKYIDDGPLAYSDRSSRSPTKVFNSQGIGSMVKISCEQYDVNGFYRRILLHYATLLTYAGLAVPVVLSGESLSAPHIKKKYVAAMAFLDRLNLPELLTKISTKVLVVGRYYGLVHTLNKRHLTLIDLPHEFCDTPYSDLYGNDIVEFDTAYFSSIIDKQAKKNALSVYPELITKHYLDFQANKVGSSKILLPPEMAVCFAFDDTGAPPLFGIIGATLEYEKAVDTEQKRALEEIRKILVQKIPHLTNTGDLLFVPDEAAEMHAGAVDMMKSNEDLSVLTTYADVQVVSSQTSAEGNAKSLSTILNNIYATGGVTGQLFSPAGAAAHTLSITNDISFMMILGNQYGRFIEFMLNHLFGNSNIEFTYKILPVSLYNQTAYIQDALKLAQSGYSWFVPSIAAGVSQHELVHLKALENELFDDGEVLKPLSLSYTQSSSEGGAPRKSDTERADKTIQNGDTASGTESSTTTESTTTKGG